MRRFTACLVATALALALLIVPVLVQGTVTTPGARQMNAHFINVGQGASVLLEFACGAALIDTGGEKNSAIDRTATLRAYLDAFFDRRTDLNRRLAMVVISHAHIDHTRGLPMVLSGFDVRLLVDNGLETGSGGRQQKAAHQKARASGSTLKWQPVAQPDGLTSAKRSPPKGTLACPQQAPAFTFMWGALDPDDGWPQSVIKNGNDSSVVTRLDFGQTSFLFPGDLEEDVQGDLVEEECSNGSSNCRLDVDVYHVSHHGSHNGTSAALMAAMRPRMAILSMGPSDRSGMFTAVAHGHPRQATLAVLLGPNGVVDARSPVATVPVARKAAKAKKPTGPQFADTKMDRAIYGTGWDNTIVISATADETLKVVTTN